MFYKKKTIFNLEKMTKYPKKGNFPIVHCLLVSRSKFVSIQMHSKGFFNKSATKVFLNKTKTVLDVNKSLYSCKSTFEAIMDETRLLLHGQHGQACRSPDAEPNY